MLLEQFLNCTDAARIAVDDLPQNQEQLRDVPDRSVRVNMPAVLDDSLHELFVEVDVLGERMPHRQLRVRHVDQYLLFQLVQTVGSQISVYLGKLREWLVDDMLSLELRSVLVEAIGDEDWNIIHPGVARSSAQEDPVVVRSDLQKCLHPVAASYQPLLVEDEECILYVLVLVNVVPAVDG